MKKLLITIPLPVSHQKLIAKIQRIYFSHKLLWNPPHNVYLSLYSLGSIDDESLLEVINKLNFISSHTKPFILHFQNIRQVPTAHPTMIWVQFVRNSAYSKLEYSIAQIMHPVIAEAISYRHVRDVPHATLAHIAQRGIPIMPPPPIITFPDLEVSFFNLVESMPTPQGPLHSTLVTFPLTTPNKARKNNTHEVTSTY